MVVHTQTMSRSVQWHPSGPTTDFRTSGCTITELTEEKQTSLAWRTLAHTLTKRQVLLTYAEAYTCTSVDKQTSTRLFANRLYTCHDKKCTMPSNSTQDLKYGTAHLDGSGASDFKSSSSGNTHHCSKFGTMVLQEDSTISQKKGCMMPGE